MVIDALDIDSSHAVCVTICDEKVKGKFRGDNHQNILPALPLPTRNFSRYAEAPPEKFRWGVTVQERYSGTCPHET